MGRMKPTMTVSQRNNDLAFEPIAEIGARMQAGTLSAAALADYCLDRTGVLSPRLNAFITVTAELAREQTRAADGELRAGRRRGALHGIPVAVKDFYDTAGIRTTAGFADFEQRVPSQDADVVKRPRSAGAVLIGKTNMHKLGMGTTSLDSHFGAVVNPWSARHVAGGSSGGSAAAVAAGLCFATIDTDAVGSGRLPAACCGVTCFKPTYGVLSTEGVLAGEAVDPAILLLSHPSIMARSAHDVTLVFESLTADSTGKEAVRGAASDRQVPVRRVGIVTNHVADDEVKAAFEKAVSALGAIGLKTLEVSVPFDAASFDVSGIDNHRSTINATMFADVDVVVLPTLSAATPTVDQARSVGDLAVAPANTFFCNYFALPAITIPNGVGPNGLPQGLQFVGPQGADAGVLAIAQAYQRATGWRYEPPPIARLGEQKP